MRIMILSIFTFISSFSFANDAIVKECLVTMKQLETQQTVEMTLKVSSKGDTYSAIITQTLEGVTSSYEDVASVQEGSVRANLTLQSDIQDLNQAEAIIVHAMNLSEDPVFQGTFTTGIDLKKVRSAKLYTIGKATKYGSATLVEARDENNQLLGSFLGGFLVSPCK